MTVQRFFDPTPDSVALARCFVLGRLPELPEADREQVSLIVSELATNAVLHAATSFSVALHVTERTITLEVTDFSPRDATPAEDIPPPDQPHGRGLLIISQLAPEWGVITNDAVSGKTVWVRLRPGVPDRAAQIMDTDQPVDGTSAAS